MAGTKRTPINRPHYNFLTPRAVALFKEGIKLQARGLEDSEMFRQVDIALHRELGLAPWHEDVLFIHADDEPPPTLKDPLSIRHWRQVHQLRYLVAPGRPIPNS
jgi:hypothetical protein